jgi:hypothetical protein
MTEAKNKRKRKTKPDLKNWLVSLFEPVTIDFVAYLPLEECAVRLESRQKLSRWRSTKTYVTITPEEDTIYDFYIKRELNNQRFFEAKGYLQSCDGNNTYITGEVVYPSKLLLTVLFIFVGIAWVFFIFHLIEALFFAVIGTLVIIAEVSTQLHQRHKLAEMIETTLGY